MSHLLRFSHDYAQSAFLQPHIQLVPLADGICFAYDLSVKPAYDTVSALQNPQRIEHLQFFISQPPSQCFSFNLLYDGSRQSFLILVQRLDPFPEQFPGTAE